MSITVMTKRVCPAAQPEFDQATRAILLRFDFILPLCYKDLSRGLNDGNI